MSGYESYRGQGQPQQHQSYGQQNQYDPPSSYSNYGGNPYEQRPQVQQQGSSYYQDASRTQTQNAQGGQGYEMNNMNGTNSGTQDNILNEVRAMDRAIDEIEGKLERLTSVQKHAAQENSSNSPSNQELERLNADIMTQYRGLVSRMKSIKQNPLSGNSRNSAQVGKVDRRLKTTINRHQQIERQFRADNQERAAREYRIVRPDASNAEVQEAVESGTDQIFNQALINSDRRGQASSVQNQVRQRHTAIQKIERDMMELAQLFQDLETLVVQQEAAVTQIDQKGEEVNDHVAKANTELSGAVVKARAARRKKWICLGIAVLIVIIIVVVVVVVVEVTKK